MDTPKHFYVVVQAEVASPVARVFDNLADADKSAQALALEHPGASFAVFEPIHGHAYRASKPRAEKIYLSWQHSPEEPPPAPATESDSF